MADETSASAASAKKKTSLAKIALGVLLLGSLGAAGWFWQRSTSERDTSDPRTIRSVLHLESFVVNLSGATENAYLRVGIDLGVGNVAKESEKQMSSTGRLRDAILFVLATQKVEELLTAEGKVKLKQDMLVAINDRVPEVQCKEVYFTEFLVQR
jgi:flagellar protein FliL